MITVVIAVGISVGPSGCPPCPDAARGLLTMQRYEMRTRDRVDTWRGFLSPITVDGTDGSARHQFVALVGTAARSTEVVGGHYDGCPPRAPPRARRFSTSTTARTGARWRAAMSAGDVVVVPPPHVA